MKRRIHFVVLRRVEQSQVELSLVSHGFANRRDLLLHYVQRGVHRVVELQLALRRDTPDIQRVVLQRHRCKYITLNPTNRNLLAYLVDVWRIRDITRSHCSA